MPATADTLRLDIDGMTCGGCVRSVRSVLEGLPGVRVEEVSLDGPAVVHLDGDATTREDVREAVEGAGFTTTVRDA